ncbi:hypothetical protein [Salinibacter sp. 10B]|uniref:hypothetical protein n=1 Tax=Salinibacter sp. 10B TaxID=1923971 RepID=UPI002156F8B7|nr:hypothetical protein [Salinibacter sp. 10B]
MPFPILIPYQTTDLPEDTRAELKWAGVRLPKLISTGGKSGNPTGLLASEDLRSQLHVSPETNILAVLNGRDDLLAAFWDMPRSMVYEMVDRHGIDGMTGPTFSISSEREGNPRTPAAQNVIMQKRHHQVVSEIETRTAAVPIPNIYWRDLRDRKQWAQWLEDNDQIHVVSRDFTMTRQTETYRPELAGLSQILSQVDRRLHVLAVGVSMEKADWTIHRLAEAGHTCSLVTSDPLFTGAAAGKRFVEVGEEVEKRDDPASNSELARLNLEVAERHLLDTAQEISIYNNTDTGNPREALLNQPTLRKKRVTREERSPSHSASPSSPPQFKKGKAPR